jgi:ABC-type lipoprotein release transport system permease subunit
MIQDMVWYLISLAAVGMASGIVGMLIGAVLALKWAMYLGQRQLEAEKKLIEGMYGTKNPDDENWLKGQLGQ